MSLACDCDSHADNDDDRGWMEMKIESVGGLPPFSFHYQPQGDSRKSSCERKQS